MDNKIQNINVNCTHSCLQHVFQSPLCQEKSTAMKVVTVVFHLLTLAIPLAIYKFLIKIHDCAFPKNKAQLPIASPSIPPVTLATIIEIVKASKEKQPKFPFSQIGQEALDFARAELMKQPELVPVKINRTADMKQPKNKEIPLLLALHKKYYNEFHSIYKNNLSDKSQGDQYIRMDSKEVQEHTDKCMKIAYAISCLGLEEIVQQAEESKRSLLQLLFVEDSFSFVTSFILPEEYRRRQSMFHTVYSGGWDRFVTLENIHRPIELFYEEGSFWNSLRALHNDFISRLKKHAGDAIPIQFDNWMKEDLDPTFQEDPQGPAPYHHQIKEQFWLPMYS